MWLDTYDFILTECRHSFFPVIDMMINHEINVFWMLGKVVYNGNVYTNISKLVIIYFVQSWTNVQIVLYYVT